MISFFISSSARKETVNINIFITSRNGDNEIIKSIRIPNRSTSRIRKWNRFR